MGDPAENPALSLDHSKAHFLKFREVRTDAVFGDKAIVATVVGFAHRRIDADFRGYSRDDELPNATILENGVEVGGEERTFPRLVDDRFSSQGIKFRNYVVACLAPDEDAAHRADVSNAGLAAPTNLFRRW